MKEIKTIIEAYDRIDKRSTKCALATVVKVEGSSYRRTGARMLVLDNGMFVGGISGGCLEGDALKRAKLAIAKSSASLVIYDTSEDDAFQIGVGLGCNGIIHVLFTPLNYEEINPIEVLKSCQKTPRKAHILLTFTHIKQDRKALLGNLKAGEMFYYTGVESLFSHVDESMVKLIEQKIQETLRIGKSAMTKIVCETNLEIEFFIEILLPEIHLVLLGHHYDIYPLLRLIKEIGWRVSVVANPLKMKESMISEVLISPEKAFIDLVFDERTAIILMSHDYKTDKNNLLKALETKVKYIGMLGPRNRAERIWMELGNEGNPISDIDKARIYAPIGLDIGAVSPEEIALSLLAEVSMAFANRTGSSLRNRLSTIHER